VSNSNIRKSRAETLPIVSKSRRTQRRPGKAATLHGHPFRVHAIKLPRRRFLHLTAGGAALPAVLGIARAQAYPTRPVRIVVAAAAGGPTDIVARLMGQWLSERLGQQFVIENRPGAGSSLGTEAVVHSPADGYTLLLVNAANAINATFYEKLTYNFIRDIAPVASIMRAVYVMEVNRSFPAKTVPEFIAYAKANPGKINMASGGIGSTPHVAGELFRAMSGVNMVHVPYRSGALALTDLIGGQVEVFFDAFIDRVHQGWSTAPIGSYHRDALGGTSKPPDRGRFRAGLRGERVVRRRRAQEYACRHHRRAEQGNHCDPR
jgi:hypothetical protein